MAATLQRKSSGGIIFVITTKIITKIIVPGNYFVIISARMVNGRNRAIVVAESLARVIAAIRIASVCWWSYLPLQTTQRLVLTDPAFVVL